MVSAEINATGDSGRCLGFWYQLVVSNAGYLSVNTIDANRTVAGVWFKRGSQGDAWVKGEVNIKTKVPVKIWITGYPGLKVRVDVAIDDIQVFKGKCPDDSTPTNPPDNRSTPDAATTPPALPAHDLLLSDGDCPRLGKCDFEKDMCGWDNNGGSEANRNWVRNSGSTPSAGTGPLADHTLGTADGTYVYLDGRSVEANETLTGVLMSQPWFAGVPHCLSFWAHMNGENGTDVPSLRINTNRTDWEQLWEVKGERGQLWIRAAVPYHSDGPFRFVLEGTLGGGYASDLVIDDISLSPGCVPYNGTLPLPPPPPLPQCRRGQFPYDVFLEAGSCRRAGFCDFETDFCTWTPTTEGLTFGWTRQNGQTAAGAAPFVDHTLQSADGYFALAVPKRQGDRARLTSPRYESAGDRCLRFWFNMAGPKAGELSVYQTVNGSARRENLKPVWRRSGDHLGIWRKGHAALPRLNNYHIV
ncbi:unnamed protein product, partial [Ixodes persulcatus]